MSFFDRFFGGDDEKELQPNIKFGRYSDAYKNALQYEKWDQSLSNFDEKKYLEAYNAFFTYLRDDDEDNVKFWDKDNGIAFEILQGSKKIEGFADTQKVKLHTKVAKTDALNVGFMRRLIELNFDLKYSRYALDDDGDIAMIFDTYTLDGSPYKLYYAIKELATNSDKQDDLLIDEFEMLHSSDTGITKEIPVAEKEAKYKFITKKITEVFEEIDSGKLNVDQYPGGIAYLMLDLSYKLDYLTKPEGYMMEALERMHRVYFAKDGKSTIEKNRMLRKELKKLLERSQEEYYKEMYNVTSTFGITSPVNHDRVMGFIDGELHNMDWYKENGYDKVALAIPGYIVGYCLFNYSIPKPDKQLFNLLYHIIEGEYFKSLGFVNEFYNTKTNKFDKRAIKRALGRIEDANEKEFPNFSPSINKLNFDSLPAFAESYLLMVRNLDVTKRA